MLRLSALVLVLSYMFAETSAWGYYYHHHHYHYHVHHHYHHYGYHVDGSDPMLSTMTVEKVFHIADADNDGFLTNKEWQARDDKDFPNLLEDYDKDNDQKISLEEFRNIEDN